VREVPRTWGGRKLFDLVARPRSPRSTRPRCVLSSRRLKWPRSRWVSFAIPCCRCKVSLCRKLAAASAKPHRRPQFLCLERPGPGTAPANLCLINAHCVHAAHSPTVARASAAHRGEGQGFCPGPLSTKTLHGDGHRARPSLGDVLGEGGALGPGHSHKDRGRPGDPALKPPKGADPLAEVFLQRIAPALPRTMTSRLQASV
jgi:hypothetical protein